MTEQWERTSPGFDTTREAYEHAARTDNEKLIERLRAVIETAVSDSYGVENDRVITKAEHDACQAERDEAEAVRDAVIAHLEKAHTPTDDEREAWRDEAIRRYPHAEVAKYMRQALQNAFIEGAKFAAGFRRTEVPEPSAEHQRHADARRAETMTLISHSEPQGEPSEAQAALDLKGLSEIIGEVVVDHADTGPHSQLAITIRDTCAAWPDLIAGEVQAHGFRRSLPLSDEALDAAFEAFRKHDRGEEFNEFGEHVCSECGYAYSWPSGVDGRQTVPARRRQRHIAREALRAAGVVGQEGEGR